MRPEGSEGAQISGVMYSWLRVNETSMIACEEFKIDWHGEIVY